MNIHTQNPIAVPVINGETKFFEIEELPENAYIMPDYEAINLGLRIERCGKTTVAIENTNSVIRTIQPQTKVGKAYALTPLKTPNQRKNADKTPQTAQKTTKVAA